MTDEQLQHSVNKIDYSNCSIAFALLSLRVSIGWILIQGGLPKVLNSDWDTTVFYQRIHENNPFHWLWGLFEGNTFIDALNAWGLTLTGFGLVIGALVRWNAFWGLVMMTLYYLATLQGGLTDFLPLDRAWVIDRHMVYMLILMSVYILGTGRVLGVDAYLEKTKFAQQRPWTKYILG